MKKNKYLIILLLLGGFVFLSCSEDEGDNPEDVLPPIISFLEGTNGQNMKYISKDTTLAIGEQFAFGITARTQSDKDLKSIHIERVYEVISTIPLLDLNLSGTNYTFDTVVATYPNNPGMEDFICTVTDGNNNSSTISFTITTTMPDPGINVFNGIELGSWESTTNSSFGSITGQTYSIAQAAADSIQAKIDWVYFNGATWGHTLMSPSDTIAEDIYPTIAGWNIKNQTRFAKTNYGPDVFNIIENDNQLVVYINSHNPSLNFVYDYFSELMSNPGGFAVNDVIAFETHLGHYGLLLITEVNQNSGNSMSTIKYNAKVVK